MVLFIVLTGVVEISLIGASIALQNIIRKCSNMSHLEQTFFTGQTVPIYVNPENENEFYCPAEKSSKIQMIFLLLGSILFVLAIVVLAVVVLLHRRIYMTENTS